MFEKTQKRLKELQELKSLPAALEIIGKASDDKVPVDKGELKNSRVNIIQGENFSIEYTAKHAIYVHEDLDAKHDNGEAKFLEKAWAEKKDEFFKTLLNG